MPGFMESFGVCELVNVFVCNPAALLGCRVLVCCKRSQPNRSFKMGTFGCRKSIFLKPFDQVDLLWKLVDRGIQMNSVSLQWLETDLLRGSKDR